MKQKLKCILLIDDREDCNYMHKMIIDNTDCTEKVQICINGKEGIEYLKSTQTSDNPKPDLIFLDINMPVMDGWEFLEEYNLLDEKLQEGTALFMLTTSMNTKDQEKAEKDKHVKEFLTKFLDEEALNKIIETYCTVDNN